MRRAAARGISLGAAVIGLALPLFVFLGRPKAHLPLYLFWPSAVSLALLCSFGQTLVVPPTMVERFARLQKPTLSPKEVLYCRRVTQIWCLFFIANGFTALLLALSGTLKAWALYTGVISYGLIGTLFSAEYAYRHWRFRPEGAILSAWMNRWGFDIPRP